MRPISVLRVLCRACVRAWPCARARESCGGWTGARPQCPSLGLISSFVSFVFRPPPRTSSCCHHPMLSVAKDLQGAASQFLTKNHSPWVFKAKAMNTNYKKKQKTHFPLHLVSIQKRKILYRFVIQSPARKFRLSEFGCGNRAKSRLCSWLRDVKC